MPAIIVIESTNIVAAEIEQSKENMSGVEEPAQATDDVPPSAYQESEKPTESTDTEGADSKETQPDFPVVKEFPEPIGETVDSFEKEIVTT